MNFVNTSLKGNHGPDALGVVSVMVSMSALIAFPEPEYSPWIALSVVGAAILINLIVRGVVGWWRRGSNKVDMILDEELG